MSNLGNLVVSILIWAFLFWFSFNLFNDVHLGSDWNQLVLHSSQYRWVFVKRLVTIEINIVFFTLCGIFLYVHLWVDLPNLLSFWWPWSRRSFLTWIIRTSTWTHGRRPEKRQCRWQSLMFPCPVWPVKNWKPYASPLRILRTYRTFAQCCGKIQGGPVSWKLWRLHQDQAVGSAGEAKKGRPKGEEESYALRKVRQGRWRFLTSIILISISTNGLAAQLCD